MNGFQQNLIIPTYRAPLVRASLVCMHVGVCLRKFEVLPGISLSGLSVNSEIKSDGYGFSTKPISSPIVTREKPRMQAKFPANSVKKADLFLAIGRSMKR
jgi:hypothetical protein